MKEITIQIEDKTYNVQVVESEDEKVQGLSNTEELPLDGMLFDYSSDPQSELTFNTIDMNYPIDIIFINSNSNSLIFSCSSLESIISFEVINLDISRILVLVVVN